MIDVDFIVDALKNIYKMIAMHSQETAAFVQALVAVGVAVLGGWGATLQVFVILMFLDYVAGILRAAKNGNMNSTVGMMGVVKKTGYLLIIATFFQIGTLVGPSMSEAYFVRTLILNIFIINEAVSVIENVRHFGDKGYLPHGIIELLEGVLAEDLRQQLKSLPSGYDDGSD